MAILIVGFFLFLHCLVIAVLGGEIKGHPALALVALVSYYILHKGYMGEVNFRIFVNGLSRWS